LAGAFGLVNRSGLSATHASNSPVCFKTHEERQLAQRGHRRRFVPLHVNPPGGRVGNHRLRSRYLNLPMQHPAGGTFHPHWISHCPAIPTTYWLHATPKSLAIAVTVHLEDASPWAGKVRAASKTSELLT